MEVKRKDGTSSSESTKSFKLKLKGGIVVIPPSHSSLAPLQAQESGEEEKEGEVMIISPPQPPSNQVSSAQEEQLLAAIDNDVDSFSTVFMPTIPISKVNMLALPISFAAPPIVTTKQCENLENVFDNFQLSQGDKFPNLIPKLQGSRCS